MCAADWKSDRPYNALPLLPPRLDLETRAVLKQCIPARAALGELKQAAALFPNQRMLIHTISCLEARASLEIENIVTTADRLFRYAGREKHADPATKEVLRYVRALLAGFQALEPLPLSARTAELVCTCVRGTLMCVRGVPATVPGTTGRAEILYTPPEGETLLRDLLANWERFLCHEIALDPLIRMAVGHYQFEAILPFTNGNGRTGRILSSLFLVQAGLLTLPILHLSRYIVRNRTDYYRLLFEVTRDEAWEPWILFIIKGVEETATWTIDRIQALRLLSEHTAEYIRAELPKIYSPALVNLIFELPYIRIVDVIKAGIAKRQTASLYLKQLVDIGVLVEEAPGREKLFLHPKLLLLLTQDNHEFTPYAARSLPTGR